AGVAHVLAHALSAIGKSHTIAPHLQQRAVEHPLGIERRFMKRVVKLFFHARLRTGAHRPRSPSNCPRLSARRAASQTKSKLAIARAMANCVYDLLPGSPRQSDPSSAYAHTDISICGASPSAAIARPLA